MHDFYFSDQPDALESPIAEHYCGSITLHGHKAIQSIFEECQRRGCEIGYFTDPMLSPSQVIEAAAIFRQAAQSVAANDTAQAAYRTILALLNEAVARKTGLRGFAD